MPPRAAIITISGIVQGVGFRPFIHRLSRKFHLAGYVRNTSLGVEIYAQGSSADIRSFYRCCSTDLPSLARIFTRKITFCKPRGYGEFVIRRSAAADRTSAMVPADIGLCSDCLRELFDPQDRRYLYPFINCTNCGPRFSIIRGLPYDRAKTTMRSFRLCPSCRREFQDIRDRRYHAQPNACSACGPQVSLLRSCGGSIQRIAEGKAAVAAGVEALKKGRIVAVKSIGGFHIAVDAYNTPAVRRLRRLKHRPSKPFALMVSDAAAAGTLCCVNAREKELLESPERPIVLLPKKKNDPVTSLLAPDNNYLGIMLCSAPLHYLLLSRECSVGSRPLRALVMTSANRADDPIEIDDKQCIEHLSGICDLFLVNDRPIHNRIDDSIVQVIDSRPVLLRRARGFAPLAFLMPSPMRETLSCGAELKNTLALSKGNFSFVSQYLGDLKSSRTFAFYKETLAKMEKTFDIRPALISADLHPDYLSSRLAEELAGAGGRTKLVRVQHHHAHLASVIAEHRLTGEVIGVCLDGTGYGSDGNIWGGEFFTGSAGGFRRQARLDYYPMPGGDKAAEQPWRMAVSYLYRAFGEKLFSLDLGLLKRHARLLQPLIRTIEDRPVVTSSCGRLFDAVSSLLGLCDSVTYEAQAAIRLQMLAERSSCRQAYAFGLYRQKHNGMLIIDSAEMIRRVAADLLKGRDKADIARAFHNGLAAVCCRVCRQLRQSSRIRKVCLSGGVFQNKLFLETLAKKLRAEGFKVYYNELLPANDGAIALGQALIANAQRRC